MKARLSICLLIISLVLGAGKARANGYTYTWTGLSILSGNWNISLNWIGGALGGVPGPGDVANIPIITGTIFSPVVNTAVTIAALNVTGTATIGMSANLTVTGAITISAATTFTGSSTLSGASLSASNNITSSAPISISGAVTITSGPTFTITSNLTASGAATVDNSGFKLTGGSTFQCASLTTTGVLTINSPLTVTGALTLNNNQAHTSNSSGVITAGSCALTGSSSFAIGAAMNVSGAITAGSTSAISGTGVLTGGSLTTSGPFTLSTSGAVTISGLTSVSGGTMTVSNTSLFTSGSFLLTSQQLTENAPLTVTGTFTTSNTTTVTGTPTTAAINLGALTTGGTFTLNPAANVTVSGLTTIAGGTATIQTTPLFKSGTMLVSGVTLNLNTPTTVTGSITTNTSSIVNGTSTLNAGSLEMTGSTFTLAGTTTVTNDITNVSGTTTYTNTGATTGASLAVTSGTLQLGSSSVATALTISGATTNTSGNTLELYRCTLTTGSYTLPGPLLCMSSSAGTTYYNTISSSGSANTISGGITLNNTYANLTVLGTGTTTISGTTTLAIQYSNLIIGSATSTTTNVIFADGSSIQGQGSESTTIYPIHNYAKLTFNGTSTGVTINFNSATQYSTIYNESTGTITANNTNLTFSASNCGITNYGTFTAATLTINNAQQYDNINNYGTFTASALTFNNPTPASQVSITNNSSGVFTANGGSTINLTGYQNFITNNGVFNAGTSGSACVINMSNGAVYISNSGSSSQTAYFNLGSTSEINVTTGYQPYVSNASTYSVFTLMSDANGSATIGQILASGISSSYEVFQGTFNIQRFMTGGSSSSIYRTYRLLSSATNTNAAAPGSTNYIDFSNFSNTAAKNKYTVYSSLSTNTTYYGAFTGGTTNFSVSNPNPTMYLYNETLNPSSATKNSTFVSGKNVGLTSISGSTVTGAGTTNGTAYTLGSTSIPVGNGYLIFFIGSINGRTTGSTSLVPDNATITNVGYMNQQSIPAYLWYTPGGSSSGSGKLSFTSTVTNGQGLNMLGNPYPSVLDLKQVYTDNSNSSGFTIFYELVDINPGQAYVSYNANTGATSSTTYSSRYVASGQGFLVQATATGQSIVFNEDQKVYNTSLLNSSSTPPALLNAQNPANHNIPISQKNDALIQNNQQLTGMHLKLSLDSTTFDECGIYFNPGGSDNYNNNDAIDLDGVRPQVYLSSFKADKVRTGINTMLNYTHGKRVKLYVRGVTDGIYHLNLEDLANIDTINFSVYLIDTKLNDSLDMVHYKTYNFNLYTADTASFANRFVLAIERKPMNPYDLITFSGQKGGSNCIQLGWNTANEGNYTTFGLQKLGTDGTYKLIDSVQSNGSGIYSFNDQNPIMGSNIYRLAQNDINGKVTFAGPININYNTISVSGMFTIYPNPSKDIINIAVNSGITSSKATPVYLASIYNLSGTVMDNRQVNTNNWTQDITGYKSGVYILELKTTDGNIVGKAKFVKTN